MYEFLVRRKENILPLLEELVKDKEFLGTISPYHAVRLQLILSYINKNDGQFAEVTKKLEEKIQALIKAEPGRVINILKSSPINTLKRKEYMLESIKGLQASFKKQPEME